MLSIFSLLILGVACYFILNETIRKQSPYEAALAQGKVLKKNLLLYFTGAELCPACKVLDQAVIQTPLFQDYLKNNVIFFLVDSRAYLGGKINPDVEKASDVLIDRFGVEQIPTLVLVTPQGREILRMSLFPPGTKPEDVIQRLNDATGK